GLVLEAAPQAILDRRAAVVLLRDRVDHRLQDRGREGGQSPSTPEAFGPGAGGFELWPCTECQSRLSSLCCGTASTVFQSSLADSTAPLPVDGLVASRFCVSASALKGARLVGAAWKASYIGVASASFRESGFIPMISSIERSTESWS